MNMLWHQYDGGSRESQALARYAMETDRRLRLYRELSEIPGDDVDMISGSVEMVQSALGKHITPEYFPEFTKGFIGRSIEYSDHLPGYTSFIKPSDKYKRFDGFVYDPNKVYDDAIPEGPYEIQSLVEILNEGRYYVMYGQCIADGWYSPDPEAEESTSPPFPKDLVIPVNWSGTIDVAELASGEVIVLECHHPFSCGWYGESSDFMKYGKWLEGCWNYMKNLVNSQKYA